MDIEKNINGYSLRIVLNTGRYRATFNSRSKIIKAKVFLYLKMENIHLFANHNLSNIRFIEDPIFDISV